MKLVISASDRRSASGKKNYDAPVLQPWLDALNRTPDDLYRRYRPLSTDARIGSTWLKLRYNAAYLIDIVRLTQSLPLRPIPNETEYSRTTRLESVLLGAISSRGDLRRQKQQIVRSNTRGVDKADKEHQWVENVS